MNTSSTGEASSNDSIYNTDRHRRECAHCGRFATLVTDAKKHSIAMKAQFSLAMTVEDYQVLYKQCLVHAVRQNKPRLVKAISDGLAGIIKAFK